MIIICEKCNKKFNVKDNLIPVNGRLLKCGNCEYEWFFKINEKTNKDFEYKVKEIDNSNENEKVIPNTDLTETEIKIPKNEENFKKKTTDKQDKLIQKSDSSTYILRNSIVFIISFIAFIIVFDTFKMYLSKFIPNIISILDNLYLSLLDVKLFIKDLFN